MVASSEIREPIFYTIIRCHRNADISNKIRGGCAIISVRNIYKVLKHFTVSENCKVTAVEIKNNKSISSS